MSPKVLDFWSYCGDLGLFVETLTVSKKMLERKKIKLIHKSTRGGRGSGYIVVYLIGG